VFVALYALVFSGMLLKKVGVLLFCQYASTNRSFQLSLLVVTLLFTEQKHLVCNYNVLLCLQALWEGL
jgi:hypothetical protein